MPATGPATKPRVATRTVANFILVVLVESGVFGRIDFCLRERLDQKMKMLRGLEKDSGWEEDSVFIHESTSRVAPDDHSTRTFGAFENQSGALSV